MEKETIVTLVEQTASAIKEAVKLYGPDAVELSFWVYQLAAIKELVVGILVLICFVALMAQWPKVIRFEMNLHPMDKGPVGASMIFVSIVAVFTTLALSPPVINPFVWMAAFGRPEAMIAKKALEATGLF